VKKSWALVKTGASLFLLVFLKGVGGEVVTLRWFLGGENVVRGVADVVIQQPHFWA
jgi:hypothetical protein